MGTQQLSKCCVRKIYLETADNIKHNNNKDTKIQHTVSHSFVFSRIILETSHMMKVQNIAVYLSKSHKLYSYNIE